MPISFPVDKLQCGHGIVCLCVGVCVGMCARTRERAHAYAYVLFFLFKFTLQEMLTC